jgi:hypothetical protein
MGSDGFMKNEPKLKISPDGTREWFLNGERHRQDGPAVEFPDGYRAWWLNGERHRQDGPAIEFPDGYRAWYLNGKRHRQDGPAVENPDGTREWWLNGRKFKNCERFLKALEKTVSEKRFQEIKSLLEIWEVMDL